MILFATLQMFYILPALVKKFVSAWYNITLPCDNGLLNYKKMHQIMRLSSKELFQFLSPWGWFCTTTNLVVYALWLGRAPVWHYVTFTLSMHQLKIRCYVTVTTLGKNPYFLNSWSTTQCTENNYYPYSQCFSKIFVFRQRQHSAIQTKHKWL